MRVGVQMRVRLQGIKRVVDVLFDSNMLMTRSKIAGRRRQASWAGSNLTRDVAEIESVNSDGSDPTPKQGLKGKTFVKKMKSAVGAISGPGSSRAAAASRELQRERGVQTRPSEASKMDSRDQKN